MHEPEATKAMDEVVRRLRRNSIRALIALTVAVAVTTWSAAQTAGLVLSGVLMLLNFKGLVATTNSILGSGQEAPGALHAMLLLSRYVLLGIGLCAIVLLPGVGPIPVALGLSILVIAVLLEAMFYLSAGADRRS